MGKHNPELEPLHARTADLVDEKMRLRGALGVVYTRLRAVDYDGDVFEQVAPLERIIYEALNK